jgi:hypothetical protein
LKCIGGLNQALYNKAVVVSVDDQSRQEIAFGVDPAAQIPIDAESFAKPVRLGEPLNKEFIIDRNVRTSQESKSNLGFRTVERLADEIATFFADFDNPTRIGFFGIEDIAAINPEVTPANSIRPALSNHDLTVFD